MDYMRLLPFIEKEELKEVATKILNGELKGIKIEALFPFLEREDLNEIVDLMIETKNVNTLKRAIPFISKSKVELIFESAEKGELPDFDVNACIPFLGADKVKDIFLRLVQKASDEYDPNNPDPDEDED